MNKNLLTSIAIIILLAACSKNTTGHRPTRPENFVNTRLTHFSGPRLFTHNGEVTNPDVVQAYFTEFNNYFFKPGDAFTDPNYQQVEFISEDSILYFASNFVYPAKRTAVDTYDKYLTHHYTITDDTNAIDLHIGQYPTWIRVQAPGGLTFYEVDDPVYFLKKVNDTVFVPVVKYITFYRKNGIVAFTSNKLNNVFSPAGVNRLSNDDTLLVQGFDVAMEKTK
jgi:hypothetical protein